MYFVYHIFPFVLKKDYLYNYIYFEYSYFNIYILNFSNNKSVTIVLALLFITDTYFSPYSRKEMSKIRE